MATDATTCPSCGARVDSGDDRCELCGTPITDDDRTEAEATPGSSPDATKETQDDETAPSPDPSSTDAARGESSAEEPAPSGVYCNQCGWKNPPGANFCSKCGTELQSVGASPAPSEDEAEDAPPEGARRVEADLPSGPAEDALQQAASAPGDDAPPSGATSPADGNEEERFMSQQLTLVVGTAVLVVVALFFVTLWSQSQNWGSGGDGSGGDAPGGSPAQAQASRDGSGPSAGSSAGPATGGGAQTQDLTTLAENTAADIPSGIRSQVDSLRARLDEVSGVRARRTKAQLVNLYVGAGQNGRAAVLQRDIARSTNDVDEWRRAANLLYRWMQDLSGQQNRQDAFTVASQAALAYEKVVADNPDDLDARTRMGETYLLTNNPMKGIEAINGVLEDDSTFVPARFQKGLALLQINRLDPAIQQFEAVKRHAEEGSGFYQQAERAIQIIRERSGSGSSGSGSPGSGRPAMPSPSGES